MMLTDSIAISVPLLMAMLTSACIKSQRITDAVANYRDLHRPSWIPSSIEVEVAAYLAASRNGFSSLFLGRTTGLQSWRASASSARTLRGARGGNTGPLKTVPLPYRDASGLPPVAGSFHINTKKERGRACFNTRPTNVSHP